MSARATLALAVAMLGVGLGAGAGCKEVLGINHLDSLADGSVGQVCDNDTHCGTGESCVDGVCQPNGGSSSGAGSGSGSGGGSSSGGASSGGSSGVSGGSSGSGSGSSSGGDGGAGVETLAMNQMHPIGIAIVNPNTPTLVWTNGGTQGMLGYCALPQCSSPLLLQGTTKPPGQIIAAGTYAYWAQSDGLFDCQPPGGCNAAGYPQAYSGMVGPIAVDPGNPTGAVYLAYGGSVGTCTGQGATCMSPTSFISVDGGPIIDMTVSPGSSWVLVADGEGVHGCPTSTSCTTTENIVMALTRGATKVAADAAHVYAAVGTTLPDGGFTSNVIAMCPGPPGGCSTPDNYTTLFTPPKGAVVTALAVDSGKLYWAQSNRNVYSCTPSASGCQGTQLLFTANTSPPFYFAFDATYLYFTDDSAGTVGRIAK